MLLHILPSGGGNGIWTLQVRGSEAGFQWFSNHWDA